MVGGLRWCAGLLQAMLGGVLRGAKRLAQLLVGVLLRCAKRLVQPSVGAPVPVPEGWTLPQPPTAHPAAEATPEATLVITSGYLSGQDQGHSFQVGRQPVTIGSGETCAIRLSATPEVAAEHARIWWRDGRLMLHYLATGQQPIVVGGKRIIDWVALQDGDEIRIGPYTLSVSTTPAREVSSIGA